MKKDAEKMILEETEQSSHLEELLVGLQKPKSNRQLRESNAGTKKDEDLLDLGKIAQDSDLLFEIITEQVKSKRIWQIVTICSILFAILLSFICFNLSINRTEQIEGLTKAKMDLQTAVNDLKEAHIKEKALENQLAASKAELEHTQNSLNSSNSDVKYLQNQLSDTSQRLRTLQNNNAEIVKQLSERLQKLTSSGKE
jgi:hypothetical protein